MPIMDIDSTVTLAQPFNPPKVEELTTAALIVGGYTFPPLMPVSVSEGNTLLNVQVESGTYNQTQIDDIVSILNVVCVDPTRNDLTEEQIEQAQLEARIEAMIADLAAITDTGGLDDQLLTNVAWNALTADAQADILRGLYRAGAGNIDYRDIILDLLRSTRYLLRMEKKRQTGVFSLTE